MQAALQPLSLSLFCPASALFVLPRVTSPSWGHASDFRGHVMWFSETMYLLSFGMRGVASGCLGFSLMSCVVLEMIIFFSILSGNTCIHTTVSVLSLYQCIYSRSFIGEIIYTSIHYAFWWYWLLSTYSFSVKCTHNLSLKVTYSKMGLQFLKVKVECCWRYIQVRGLLSSFSWGR